MPGYDGLLVAVGFSGHGFKLALTLSEALAQTVWGLPVRVPIDKQRFEEDAAVEYEVEIIEMEQQQYEICWTMALEGHCTGRGG